MDAESNLLVHEVHGTRTLDYPDKNLHVQESFLDYPDKNLHVQESLSTLIAIFVQYVELGFIIVGTVVE